MNCPALCGISVYSFQRRTYLLVPQGKEPSDMLPMPTVCQVQPQCLNQHGVSEVLHHQIAPRLVLTQLLAHPFH